MIKIFCSRWVKMIALVVVLGSVVSIALVLGKGADTKDTLALILGKGVIAQSNVVKATGRTWVRVLTPMTCEQTCSSVGSKLLVDKCYGMDAKKNPKLCTLSKDGYCIDYDSGKITGGSSDMECCCEGTDFKGCTSTDGGDPFVKGTASNGKTTVTDKCQGNELVSYKCSSWGNVQFLNNFVCPNGCKDGACVKKPVPTCTDSDGGSDHFTKGIAKESISPLMDYTDMCGGGSSTIPQGHELIEWNCDGNGRVINKYYNCPYGCEDGACMKEPSEDDEDQLDNQKEIQELIAGVSGVDSMLGGVNVMEKAFKQIVKQGIAMPSDLEETITRVKELGPEVKQFNGKKAEDVTEEEAETLTDNLNELCEIGVTLEEWGGQVPQFMELGAKMKQVTKDLKKVKSDVSRAAKVAARSKFDIADKGDEINEAFETLKTTLDDVNASTDFDEKNGMINEFYNQFQDVYDTIGMINSLQNTTKAKAEWGKRVKENVRIVNQISKDATLDKEEVTAKRDEIKAKIDELGVVLAKKPIDRDEIKWIFEDLKTLQSEFIDIADQVRGVNSALPKVKVAKFDMSQFKNFSVFSEFCGVTFEYDDEEEVLEDEYTE